MSFPNWPLSSDRSIETCDRPGPGSADGDGRLRGRRNHYDASDRSVFFLRLIRRAHFIGYADKPRKFPREREKNCRETPENRRRGHASMAKCHAASLRLANVVWRSGAGDVCEKIKRD